MHSSVVEDLRHTHEVPNSVVGWGGISFVQQGQHMQKS